MLRFLFRRKYNRFDCYTFVGTTYMITKHQFVAGIVFCLLGAVISAFGEAFLETNGGR